MYLPLEEDGTLHLNKIESPSTQDDLCQDWLKLAQWFWRRFLNFVNVFLLFCNYLPLNALHPRMPSLVEIGTMVLEKIKK